MMRRLDSAQLAAAKGRASIQLTLAGPGSGKTSTLTGRFVYLIRQAPPVAADAIRAASNAR